jgi:ABC-2 type transport system ATP-binding protein
VRGVSLHVDRGEIFGLLGPNGAGKTTLVECIVGLRKADAGRIEVDGIDATRRSALLHARIGVVLQSTALQDKITPREALHLFGSFFPHAVEPTVLLDRFGLNDKADARFDTLSGGQRQRLALALAMLNSPEVLLLDEPTAGLDPQSRRDVREQIRTLKADGRTVLLTTHDIDEAERLCDRVAIIDRGEILAVGEPQALVAEPAALQVVHAWTSVAVAAERVATIDAAREVSCHGNRIEFQTADATRSIASLTALLQRNGVAIVELHVQRPSLEDVFLRLTRGDGGDES